MPYRRPAREEERPHVVRYGPFPLRRVELVLGVAGVVVLFAGGAALGSERMECARSELETTCTIERTSLLLPDRTDRFGADDVVEVRFVPYEGDKRTERGRTELIDRIGRPRVLFDTGREEAREAFEVVDAFFRDPAQRTMTCEADPPWLGVALLVAIGLFAVGAGVTALRQVTSMRLLVYPRSARLRVERRWLGIPVGTTERSIEDVTDVRVETGGIHPWTRQRRLAPIPAGRLLLVTRHGEEAPLTERLLPGTSAHEAAAQKLRNAILDVEPEPAPIIAEATDGIAQAEPAPEQAPLRIPPQRRRMGPVIRWALAVVLLGAAGQGLVLLYADQTQGWLEVRCAERCRMGGLECLPGGSWSSSMDPGTHTMEVWNPDVGGHWEPVRFRIAKGRTTTFVCRAGAEDAEPGD